MSIDQGVESPESAATSSNIASGAADGVGGEPPPTLWAQWLRLRSKDPRRGQWLAEARRGAGKRAGSVPVMWPLYRASNSAAGTNTDRVFEAEHICLVLFGFHQQSKDLPMHSENVSLAAALQRLRESARFRDREKALDSKVFAAATSTTVVELQQHLRSLVALLKTEDLGFNYTQLLRDLTTWQRPGGPDIIRRAWGRRYYARRKLPAEPTASSPTTKGTEK